eukprot:7197338-Prymnesium_polylepis.1
MLAEPQMISSSTPPTSMSWLPRADRSPRAPHWRLWVRGGAPAHLPLVRLPEAMKRWFLTEVDAFRLCFVFDGNTKLPALCAPRPQASRGRRAPSDLCETTPLIAARTVAPHPASIDRIVSRVVCIRSAALRPWCDRTILVIGQHRVILLGRAT